MEKRALVAVAISFAILLIYQYFFVKPVPPQKVQNPQVVEQKSEPATAAPQVPPIKVAPIKNIASVEKDVRIETELYSVVFTTKGATIKQYELKKYKDKDGNDVSLLKNPGIIPPLGIGSKDDFNLANVNFHVASPGGTHDITLDKDKTILLRLSSNIQTPALQSGGRIHFIATAIRSR